MARVYTNKLLCSCCKLHNNIKALTNWTENELTFGEGRTEMVVGIFFKGRGRSNTPQYHKVVNVVECGSNKQQVVVYE